ncbi:MAG TPA: phosphatase PAP2-related protein [Bacteroidia bacterium]|jgi:hypothetical protein|nr:phosphatase PAP2-related protein [Bacteroidia bacterium]
MDNIELKWSGKWQNKSFRLFLTSGIILTVGVLICTYHFFAYIESVPDGVVLNDWLLSRIPSIDVSAPIVCTITSVIVLFLVRSVTNPEMFVTFLIAFLFLFISRIITIDITRFKPPVGLIELKDPIAGIVYKSKFIKRDLFFSGHTAVLFLFFLCARRKIDKIYMLCAVLIVAPLLLVQHVHYTIDVLCAPLFSTCCYWFSKKVLSVYGAVEYKSVLKPSKVDYTY